MSFLRTVDRECEPGRNKNCLIFHWIGQSMAHCDNCGKSVDVHLYMPPYGGTKPRFHIKHYNHFLDKWTWQPVQGFLQKPQECECPKCPDLAEHEGMCDACNAEGCTPERSD